MHHNADTSNWPASRAHHHAYPGGLLFHSLECAYWALQWLDVSAERREVAVLAALLHDIGKIVTHDAQGNLTATGRVLQHELLTLRVLAKHLHWLEQQDEAFAIELQRILTIKHSLRFSSRYSWSLADEAVALADKRSAMLAVS